MAATIDSDAIIQARIRGYSTRQICKTLGCTPADVSDTLDNFARLTLTKSLRTHTLALELARLDELQRVFEKQAKAGDAASAIIVLKITERRCMMLGLSAPPRVDPHIIEMQIQPAVTSTERIRAALDRLAIAKPEPPKPDEPDPVN